MVIIIHQLLNKLNILTHYRDIEDAIETKAKQEDIAQRHS